MEVIGGGSRYSSNLFTTSALDTGQWSASRPGRSLSAEKGPTVPIVQEAGWVTEPVWTEVRGTILSPLPEIEPQSPGLPVRRQTPYWLSYTNSVNSSAIFSKKICPRTQSVTKNSVREGKVLLILVLMPEKKTPGRRPLCSLLKKILRNAVPARSVTKIPLVHTYRLCDTTHQLDD
jgi:hypothetical protein